MAVTFKDPNFVHDITFFNGDNTVSGFEISELNQGEDPILEKVILGDPYLGDCVSMDSYIIIGWFFYSDEEGWDTWQASIYQELFTDVLRCGYYEAVYDDMSVSWDNKLESDITMQMILNG